MLTEQQEAAVEAVVDACRRASVGERPEHFVLEAVAGSGKTRTLTSIVERLVQRRCGDRLSVLLLQFNQEGCRHMRERLRPYTVGGAHHIHVHTIHSFGLQLLGQPEVDPEKMYKVWHRLRGDAFGDSNAARAEWVAVQAAVNRMRHHGVIPDLERGPLTLANTVLRECVRQRTVVDQEDAVYHALYYHARAKHTYTLVLVDEAQDLNDANHRFLRDCVVPRLGPTVLCAVGDQGQAIYQFRGANPDSLCRLRQLFCATQLYLTCCFRCPRRVVSVASHLLPSIRAAPTADLGGVTLCKAMGWQSLLVMLENVPVGETILFVSRTNRGVLNLIRYLYRHRGVPHGRRVRWAAPSLLANLLTLGADVDPVATVLARAQSDLDDSRAPIDGGVLRILEVAADTDVGPSVAAEPSPFLAFVLRLLSETDADITMATIHASKGAEHDHVFLDQYNLIGNGEDRQDRNLLYIAITRARKTLTFFVHGRSQYIPSTLLPSGIIAMSGHLDS